MKREYPTRLLPKLSYVNDIQAKGYSLDRFYVQRNTEGNTPVHDLYEIRENLGDHIQDSRYIGGLSMNLVGVYRRNDSRFVVNYKKSPVLKEDWSQNLRPLQPWRNSFSYQKKAGFFGFLIADVLKIKKEHILKKEGSDVGKYEVSFILEHKPTRCNYWHIEFHLYGKCLEEEGVSGKLIDLAEKKIISKSQVDKIGGMMTKEFRAILKIRSNIVQYHIPELYYTF